MLKFNETLQRLCLVTIACGAVVASDGATSPANSRSSTSGVVLFITTDIRPYNLRLVPNLSFPPGFIYRFRYAEKWVEDGRKNLSAFASLPCLIVFSPDESSFLPVRSCEVLKAQEFGDVLFFDLKLGHLVDSRESRFEQFSDLIRAKVYSGRNRQPNDKVVFITNQINLADFSLDDEKSPEESNRIWTEIVSRLGKREDLAKVAFFKIALWDDDKELQPVALSNKQVGYSITSGDSYRFEVFEYVSAVRSGERVDKTFDFVMETDSTLLAGLKNSETVDGAYDRFYLFFRATQILTSQTSFIILRSKQTIPKKVASNQPELPKKGDSSRRQLPSNPIKSGAASGVEDQVVQEDTIPEVYIPIEIQNHLWKRIVLFIGSPLCMILFLFPGVLSKLLKTAVYKSFGREWFKRNKWFKLAASEQTVQAIAALVFLMILANWDVTSFVQRASEKFSIK